MRHTALAYVTCIANLTNEDASPSQQVNASSQTSFFVLLTLKVRAVLALDTLDLSTRPNTISLPRV